MAEKASNERPAIVNPDAPKWLQEVQREAERITLKRMKDAEEEKAIREEDAKRLAEENAA